MNYRPGWSAVATVATGSHRRSSASTSSPPGRRHPSVPYATPAASAS